MSLGGRGANIGMIATLPDLHGFSGERGMDPVRNVVLVTIDALRQDMLATYGHRGGLSPFIDSIADSCVVFERTQATGPYTQASFPGILTSSHYFDHGRSTHLSQQRTLISEPLRKAGIVTAAFHSNPYLSEYFGWNREWDVFRDFMDVDVSDTVPFLKGDDINRHASDWLSSHVGKRGYKSFFLWVHYMDVHEPYVPRRNYLKMVHPSVELSEDEMFRLFKDVLLKRNVSDKQRVDLLRKLYEARVREVDDHVKQLFGMLEQLEVLQDCIVIMTSDHGDEFGEHGGLSHDGKMYQELLAVPLLIFDPERKRKEICSKLVSSIDISPTIISLLGLDPVKNFQGQPLLPAGDYEEEGCFGEAVEKLGHKTNERDKEVYYYMEGDLKIIYRGNTDAWEIYNLRDDPDESNNLIGATPESEQIARMRAVLKQRIGRWK